MTADEVSRTQGSDEPANAQPTSGNPTVDERQFHETMTEHMVRSRLDVLLDATSEFGFPTVSAQYVGVPAPGSPMDEDVGPLGANVVGRVQRACGTWHMVGTEQLVAVATLHQMGHLAWAPGPLVRSVLEHASRIAWVLTAPDAKSRAARSWLAEVVAQASDSNTHENLSDHSAALSGAPERLRTLVEETIPAVFGEKPTNRGTNPERWTLCGEVWPNNTDAIAVLFERCVEPRTGVAAQARVQYRLASMFAHPSLTAAFTLADTGDPRSGQATFSWSWPLTRSLVLLVLISWSAISDALYEYLGWTPVALEPWKGHLASLIADTEPIPAQTDLEAE